jgi:hypothetical protein
VELEFPELHGRFRQETEIQSVDTCDVWHIYCDCLPKVFGQGADCFRQGGGMGIVCHHLDGHISGAPQGQVNDTRFLKIKIFVSHYGSRLNIGDIMQVFRFLIDMGFRVPSAFPDGQSLCADLGRSQVATVAGIVQTLRRQGAIVQAAAGDLCLRKPAVFFQGQFLGAALTAAFNSMGLPVLEYIPAVA